IPKIVVTPPNAVPKIGAANEAVDSPIPTTRRPLDSVAEVHPSRGARVENRARGVPKANGSPVLPRRESVPTIPFLSTSFPLALPPADAGHEDEAPGQKKASKFQLSDLSRRKFKWIHAPSNNTAWVGDILKTISREKRIPNYHTALLRDKHWNSKQNRARHSSPHANYMHPTCAVLPTYGAEQGSDVESKPINTRPHVRLALYIPYLHWDSFRAFKIRASTIKKRLLEARSVAVDKEIAESESLERRWIWQYLPSRQIHCRRTLDQFRYPNLPNTAVRDGDQILYKRTSKLVNANSAMDYKSLSAEVKVKVGTSATSQSRDLRTLVTRATREIAAKNEREMKDEDGGKILMVDQLWLFIMDGETVVTFFPAKEKEPGDESLHRQADLRGSIYNEVNDDLAPRCENCLDFAALVVQHAMTNFLSPGRRLDDDLQVFRIFEESIGILTELENSSFKKFRDRSYNPSGSTISLRMLKEYQEDNKKDLTALMELRDVEDELKTLELLLQTQHGKIEELIAEFEKLDATQTINGKDILEDTLQTVKDHMEQVTVMLGNANYVQQAYKDLLDMKQKEQSTDEARQARRQAETATRQSRSVMVFTVFTVIFLPLSFFTSLFGMNVREWTGQKSNLSARRIFTLMAFISFAVIFVALLVAFNGTVRSWANKGRHFVIRCGNLLITGGRLTLQPIARASTLRRLRRWTQRAIKFVFPRFLLHADHRVRGGEDENPIILRENSQQFWHQIASETRVTDNPRPWLGDDKMV
ncbi:MAG: hypothetical protein M1825_004953, partial [Sarcosagium campestre]